MSEAPEGPHAEPQAEHRWLHRLVGEWTYESEASMGPDQAPAVASGTLSVRSIGGLWIVGEGRGQMPGMADEAVTIITLGYDPQRGRFRGSFIGSMMTSFWLYDGSLEGDRLTLDSEGPSFTGEGLSPYQDVVEIVSDDHHILRSLTLGPDGAMMEFMTAHYRRR